jgi:hypothetical protein
MGCASRRTKSATNLQAFDCYALITNLSNIYRHTSPAGQGVVSGSAKQFFGQLFGKDLHLGISTQTFHRQRKIISLMQALANTKGGLYTDPTGTLAVE